MPQSNPFLQELAARFTPQANPTNAAKQSAYMLNQFAYLGLPKPLVNELTKKLLKEQPLTEDQAQKTILLLWQQPAREYQYAALLVARSNKKLWTPEWLTLFEQLIRDKSWWDSVDEIAADLVGPLIAQHPELITHADQWVADDLFWLRRTALIFQLKWKEHTDQKRLFRYCKELMHEKEFFIRKAIGWALRQYSKTNPKAVKEFVTAHHEKLSGLSRKEASKYI